MSNLMNVLPKHIPYLLLPLILGVFTPALAQDPIDIPVMEQEQMDDDPDSISRLLLMAYEKEYNEKHNTNNEIKTKVISKKAEPKKPEVKKEEPDENLPENFENFTEEELEIIATEELKELAKKNEQEIPLEKREVKTKAEKQQEKEQKKLEKQAEKQAEQAEKVAAKEAKKAKKENPYAEYLIPENAYKPVGNVEDKQIYIQGAVSKTEQLSLADCLAIALQNNPKIKSAYSNSAAVKENKVQTASNYSPTLSTRTGITRIKPDMSGMPAGFSIPSYTKYLLGTISLSQLVYDFGVTQNQYTINKIEWETSKQNIESVVNQVVRDVKDNYYNLLYAISAKQVRYETVEQFEQMYKQAQAFYEIGTKPKVDVTIAASNLADARANYIEATNAVDLAVSKLNNAMGTPFIDPYVVDTSMPYQETDITMQSAIEIANKARPDLQMAISGMKMADEYVKLSKKTYMPRLSVGADLSMGGRHDFTDKNWYSVGGYLDFPVINPVKITSEIKQAKALLDQQKYDTKSIVNDIYYEIQTTFVQLNDARQKITASKVAVEKAKESYDLSKGRYKAGVCDAIELKEAQITYESAKLAYISNVYMYNSAKASLEKAIGQSLQPVKPQENIEI